MSVGRHRAQMAKADNTDGVSWGGSRLQSSAELCSLGVWVVGRGGPGAFSHLLREKTVSNVEVYRTNSLLGLIGGF